MGTDRDGNGRRIDQAGHDRRFAERFTAEERAAEEWRPIPGLDRYMASSLGRVKRDAFACTVERSTVGKMYAEPRQRSFGSAVLLPMSSVDVVRLSGDGTGSYDRPTVGRLVADAFLYAGRYDFERGEWEPGFRKTADRPFHHVAGKDNRVANLAVGNMTNARSSAMKAVLMEAFASVICASPENPTNCPDDCPHMGGEAFCGDWCRYVRDEMAKEMERAEKARRARGERHARA